MELYAEVAGEVMAVEGTGVAVAADNDVWVKEAEGIVEDIVEDTVGEIVADFDEGKNHFE